MNSTIHQNPQLPQNNTLPESVEWFAQNQDIFGRSLPREAVLLHLQQDPTTYQAFLKLSDSLKEEFLSFCMGTQGLHITYDPVFKCIFNPETNPERLEEFLSLCLNENLKIVQVLPNDSRRLTEEGSLLIMDILVRLASGALVNIEIQRIGYLFPGARCACYSSDLVMRQYSQIREQKRRENRRFSYKDIKRVYTIVLIQKSSEEFHDIPAQYLHHSQQIFDTGLKLDMLQQYLTIPLDIFRQTRQNISSKLDAWLYFISSDTPEDIRKVIEAYPAFKELYREVFHFRYQMKELVSMFSEALQMLDADTVQYMIEIQQEEIKENRRIMEEDRQTIAENQKIIEEGKQTIAENQQTIAENQKVIAESRQTIAENQQTIAENQQTIAENQQTIANQQQEIARLKALLAAKEAV